MRRSPRIKLRFENLERRLPLAGLPTECGLADVDDNRVVDAADVALVAKNFGGTTGRHSGGDADGNAVVNLRDLIAVQAQFGSDCNEPRIRFAAIGDYGLDGPDEAAVATLVKNANPDFVITLGDNNYGIGAEETIDANIGKHYQEFIGDYVGSYGPGSPINRFFPSLGNHDWWFPEIESIAPYLDYFNLPGDGFASSSGNERYYDFVWGPVHFFAVNSNNREPDGRTANSLQGHWLRQQIGLSSSPWQVVYFHESPYSSGSDSGSTAAMQWPFDKWGADLVLSAHDHNYERLSIDGLTYLVAGTGGAALRVMNPLVPGSIVTYNEAHGALIITADAASIRAEFHSVADGGTLIDCVAIGSTICDESPSPAAQVAPPASILRSVATSQAETPRIRSRRLVAARIETHAPDVSPPRADPILSAEHRSRDTARRGGRALHRPSVDAAIADLAP